MPSANCGRVSTRYAGVDNIHHMYTVWILHEGVCDASFAQGPAPDGQQQQPAVAEDEQAPPGLRRILQLVLTLVGTFSLSLVWAEAAVS